MTIYGWDMSHYDAPSIGNAVAQGISFITHKAGGDAPDDELDNWWAGVRNLPQDVILGAYWVLYPGNPSGRADTFLSTLDARCPGWRNRESFILQIDAEIWGGKQSTKPSVSECNAFADRLVARTNGRYTPVGYLPKWVYGNVASFRYPLWASSYVSGSGGFKALYPGDNSSKWNGYGKPVTILQYSSSATIGGQTTSDANAYRGTVDQLKALVTRQKTPQQEENVTTADDVKTGILQLFAEASNATDTDPNNDTQEGRNFRRYLDAVIDFSNTAGPLAKAVSDLTALVMTTSAVSATEIAAALAPLIHVEDGATPAEVEQAVRNVLGSLNDAS